MTGFIGVVEQARLAPEARRRARLALRDGDRGELRAVHAREGDEIAVGVDDGDVQLPAMLDRLGLDGGDHLLRHLGADRGAVGNIERGAVGGAAAAGGAGGVAAGV
jgi:hypothetical protein